MMSSQNSQPWADTPLPLLPIQEPNKASKDLSDIDYIARDMSNAHNSLIRILNSIYNQAPFVSTPKDVSDFLQYCRFWCMWITEHHDAEEKFLFPWLEEATQEKGLMERNVQQHLAFEAGVKEFEEYASGVKVQDYDSGEVRRIIDSFGEAFTVHLREEIDSLRDLEKYGDKKWREIYDRFVDEIRKGSSLDLFPLALGASDKSVMAWPELPFFVPYLCYFLFSWKNAGAWRFSPSTLFGVRRPLAFTAAKE